MPAAGSRRELRLAKNETFFRESNELAVEDPIRRGSQVYDIICECSAGGCVKHLALTRDAYEHVRANDSWFVVAIGHEDLSIVTVVERHDGYLVIEKTGLAGIVARAEGPS